MQQKVLTRCVCGYVYVSWEWIVIIILIIKRGKGKISISLKVTRFYFVKQQTTQINNKINWTLICQNVTSVIVCVCVCECEYLFWFFFFFKSHAKEISWSINFNCVFHVKGIFRCICDQFSSIYIPFFFFGSKIMFLMEDV